MGSSWVRSHFIPFSQWCNCLWFPNISFLNGSSCHVISTQCLLFVSKNDNTEGSFVHKHWSPYVQHYTVKEEAYQNVFILMWSDRYLNGVLRGFFMTGGSVNSRSCTDAVIIGHLSRMITLQEKEEACIPHLLVSISLAVGFWRGLRLWKASPLLQWWALTFLLSNANCLPCSKVLIGCAPLFFD